MIELLALTPTEQSLVKKVVFGLEMSADGKCLECGRGRMFHLLRPLDCDAVVGILRARLECGAESEEQQWGR